MIEKMTNIVKLADMQWDEWNRLGCALRGELLLHWADEIAKQAGLGLQASKMAKFQIKQGLMVIAEEKIMPGPTGESNELYTSGRGVFVFHCSSDTPLSALIGMISTVLLAGNTLILSLANELHQTALQLHSSLVAAGLPKLVVQVASLDSTELLIKSNKIAGIMYAGHYTESLKLNKQLASREGKIVQLILETELTLLTTITDRYFVLLFITERTRTINITAVGGNAKLLELGCGDR